MGIAMQRAQTSSSSAREDVGRRVDAIRTKVFELVRQLQEASADCDVYELDEAGHSMQRIANQLGVAQAAISRVERPTG
jgi:hypothetical protein